MKTAGLAGIPVETCKRKNKKKYLIISFTETNTKYQLAINADCNTIDVLAITKVSGQVKVEGYVTIPYC